MSPRWINGLAFDAIAAGLGLAAMVGPAWVTGAWHPYQGKETLLPEMSVSNLLLLCFAGGASGSFSKASILRIGVATIIPLPLMAIADMVQYPQSHNLWPFEFAIYAVLILPVLLGGVLGRGARNS